MELSPLASRRVVLQRTIVQSSLFRSAFFIRTIHKHTTPHIYLIWFLKMSKIIGGVPHAPHGARKPSAQRGTARCCWLHDGPPHERRGVVTSHTTGQSNSSSTSLVA